MSVVVNVSDFIPLNITGGSNKYNDDYKISLCDIIYYAICIVLILVILYYIINTICEFFVTDITENRSRGNF